jgi:hypothetical protein
MEPIFTRVEVQHDFIVLRHAEKATKMFDDGRVEHMLVTDNTIAHMIYMDDVSVYETELCVRCGWPTAADAPLTCLACCMAGHFTV